MDFEPDVSKLEDVVTRLLDEYDVLKKKCEQLTLDLADSLVQVDELKEEKIALLNEKETVHGRVTTILDKLSDWEEGLVAEVDGENADAHQDASSGQLFTMGSSS